MSGGSSMVVVPADVTAEEIDECLAHINAEAKRCTYGTPRWDDLHKVIDILLDKRESADA